MRRKSSLATKKDLKETLEEIRKLIGEQADKILTQLRIFFRQIEKKLDLIHKETRHTRVDILKTQKALFEKVKDHEERLRRLESNLFKN